MNLNNVMIEVVVVVSIWYAFSIYIEPKESKEGKKNKIVNSGMKGGLKNCAMFS